MTYIKQGDYIELKTGSVAKVVEMKKHTGAKCANCKREVIPKGEKSNYYFCYTIRMRVLTKKGYTYQYTRTMDMYDNWKWVKRIFNTEDILRLVMQL